MVSIRGILLCNSVTHFFLAEKSRLRKQIPSTILYISTIASKTTSLEYILHMLKLLIQLTSDQVSLLEYVWSYSKTNLATVISL
jgi:hypothetical protein